MRMEEGVLGVVVVMVVAVVGQGRPEGLVESLADGGNTHTQGGGLFHGDVVGDFDLDVTLGYDVLGECTVFEIVAVALRHIHVR